MWRHIGEFLSTPTTLRFSFGGCGYGKIGFN